MRGALIDVWGETWRELWAPVFDDEHYGDDLMMDIYRILFPLPPCPEEPNAIDLKYDDAGKPLGESDRIIREYRAALSEYDRIRKLREEYESGTRPLRPEFNGLIKSKISTEKQATKFLRSVWKLVTFYDDPKFSERYYQLVSKFLQKFSIRYDLRRPFHICPTLPGIFSSLVIEMKKVSSPDQHLSDLVTEFEDSLRDLNIAPTQARIKSLIQKQVNLIEAIGCSNASVKSNTLGKAADELKNWPHLQLRSSLKELYKFTCDYPGIRHAGTPANKIKDLSLRDAIAVSVLITAFIPYLVDNFDPNGVYFAS